MGLLNILQFQNVIILNSLKIQMLAGNILKICVGSGFEISWTLVNMVWNSVTANASFRDDMSAFNYSVSAERRIMHSKLILLQATCYYYTISKTRLPFVWTVTINHTTALWSKILKKFWTFVWDTHSAFWKISLMFFKVFLL